MARGDRRGAPRRADRRHDHDLIEALLLAGLTAREVQTAYSRAGRGYLPVGTVYAMRNHLGLRPVHQRHSDLIPWRVLPEHSHAFPAQMLRLEGRRRRGDSIPPADEVKRARFIRRLTREDIVVDYSAEHPDYRNGWAYVERRPGIDRDIIRDPFVDDSGRRIARPAGLRTDA